MGINAIGSRTSGSLGVTKTLARAVTNEGSQITAADYNAVADAVLELQTAVGTSVSPATGSLEQRLLTAIWRNTYVTSSTSASFVASDAGNAYLCDNATDATFTLPTNAAQPFPVGSRLCLTQRSTGAVNVVGAGGVTVLAGGGRYLARTVGAGARVLIEKINTNTWAAFGDLVEASSWASDAMVTTFTPTLSAGGGGAAIGNGTLVGNWTRSGATITASWQLTVGSTTAFGTGDLRMSLPATPGGLRPNQIGTALMYDVSAGQFLSMIAFSQASLSYVTFRAGGFGGIVSGSAPVAFGSGDLLYVTITYIA